ncbi:delta-aminolevulinic acid dehydratase [Brumimicrobium glaciale]|uniref:Delta-aminolevulinic acid dehydratase n=2 Tax=Brumimicrobium glaciale TaxID=200475 RepID=A0A4Q4KJU4_9FLAO|nr:delta-aminolevulinic acid dehydratase [Brumimicrobium glaciale]
MQSNLNDSFNSLKSYCEKENFAGWDPYDGLNSKIFRATPLKKWDLARLAWIQGFKRSPINFRKLLMVPKQHNAKGIGLFLNGYCNLYILAEKGDTSFGTKEEILMHIHELAELLLEMQNKDYSGACWGYNFDWQARRLFLFPAHTPTVVATSFCVTALLSAYEITKNKTYLETALSAGNFILNDLNRTEYKSGFLFSYSPLNGNNTVFNASLLGGKVLSQLYSYNKNELYRETAEIAVRTCVEAQSEDGSWIYGMLPVQTWIDSFHTGYNLDAIQTYQDKTGDLQFNESIEKGFKYYIENFFLADGTPKYYHDKTYPIDIHCPGQLFVNLWINRKFEENKVLADSVFNWVSNNMQDKKGYFYYQVKEGMSSKIPYMRWSNAFMFNAMSYLLLEEKQVTN